LLKQDIVARMIRSEGAGIAMTAGADPLTSRATSQATSGPPTPVVQFRAFVDAFERLGYDVSRLLADIGVKRSELDDPDALIPCAVTGALFSPAQEIRPIKNLWTELAVETPLGAFRLLDYLILTSDTVGDGFKQNARYFGLVGAPFVLDIRDDEDPIRVIFVSNGPSPLSSVEYGVTLDVRGYRAETENRVTFAYVSFAHQPDDIAEIERLLGCPVHAGASWAGLALSHDAWHVPLRRRDPVLRVLESQADAVSSHVPARRTVPGLLPQQQVSLRPRSKVATVATLSTRRRLSTRVRDDVSVCRPAQRCAARTALDHGSECAD
jgi:Arabinose-binding domain of AraC transcription regulator, N-term